MVESVELLKEAAALSVLTCGIVPSVPHQRNPAIRCALLVRATKLARSLVIDTCVADGDQQLVLSRQVIETVATLAYLLEDEDGSRHESYVADSLVGEREMMKDIAARQADGDGAWPIEERMIRSIRRSAAAAEVDLDDLPSRKSIGWPTAERRIELLGPQAYVAYRSGSGAVHGGWHDLYARHLTTVDGGFVPDATPGPARPQPLLMTGVLLAEISAAYLRLRPAEELVFFESRLTDLLERLKRVDELHETWLQRRG